MSLLVATWNVNSIKARLLHVQQWLAMAKPDILLLQEIKCVEEAFPTEAFEDAGYNVAVCGQKTYNGVAIASRWPLEDIVKVLPGDEEDEQARYIEAVASIPGGAVRVASIYVPNGTEVDSPRFAYKLRFFERLQRHFTSLLDYEECFVAGGDYNVAPADIDVYDPVSLRDTLCFHPKEQAQFQRLLHLGMQDAFRLHQPQTQHFSWWDYRGGGWQQNKGMRIDHLLLSPQAADVLEEADIDDTPRGWEKPSDHTPVTVRLF